MSEQIRSWDTLACCCDVKQPTNKPRKSSVYQGSPWNINFKVTGKTADGHPHPENTGSRPITEDKQRRD